MIDKGYFSNNDKELFKPITSVLLNSDYYMVLADYKDYIRTQDEINSAFKKKKDWSTKSIMRHGGRLEHPEPKTVDNSPFPGRYIRVHHRII